MADTLDVASMIDTDFSAHVKSQKKVKKETKKSDDSAPKRTRMGEAIDAYYNVIKRRKKSK